MVATTKAGLFIETHLAQLNGNLVRCVARSTPHCQTALRCSLHLAGLGTTITDTCSNVKVDTVARLAGSRSVARSAEAVSNHLLHVATHGATLFAAVLLRCVLIRKKAAEARLAVPTVARLSRLWVWCVARLTPPCSRRLRRGWGQCKQTEHTQYGQRKGGKHMACHQREVKEVAAARHARVWRLRQKRAAGAHVLRNMMLAAELDATVEVTAHVVKRSCHNQMKHVNLIRRHRLPLIMATNSCSVGHTQDLVTIQR